MVMYLNLFVKKEKKRIIIVMIELNKNIEKWVEVVVLF